MKKFLAIGLLLLVAVLLLLPAESEALGGVTRYRFPGGGSDAPKPPTGGFSQNP